MSSCNNCGTTFKISDALKGLNPASVKCSGCPERIKSSYITLLIIFVIYIGLFFGVVSFGITSGSIFDSTNLIMLFVLALVFELLYFYLLSSGKIKSNLDIGLPKT